MEINQVFLFIPNLIGYIRACLYLSAFSIHLVGQWQLCIIFYSLGFLLDELDGKASQIFNQRSNFGAALDMVLDRCATLGLCLILAQLYPNYLIVFILLISLDISSHYYLLYANQLVENDNHKDVESWSSNWLLNLYYNKKAFFDLLIVGNEIFYILLYINYYSQGIKLTYIGLNNLGIWQCILFLCVPLYLLKQLINIVQLQSAATKIAAIDLSKRN